MDASLETFAANVKTACADTDAVTYFGDRKVFICTIAEAMTLAGTYRGSLEAFKAMLTACRRAGLLAMSRADLVSAMDPELVRWSEIAESGATFHFVNVESRG